VGATVNILVFRAEVIAMDIEVASVKPVEEARQSFGCGAQWGLASLIIGSVIFLASPVLLAFNTLLAHGGHFGMPMGLVWTASIVGFVALLAMAIAAVVFGVRGWTLSRRMREPLALGIAGTLMSVAALLSWLIAGIDLIIVLATF
jgi:hypothetical protein